MVFNKHHAGSCGPSASQSMVYNKNVSDFSSGCAVAQPRSLVSHSSTNSGRRGARSRRHASQSRGCPRKPPPTNCQPHLEPLTLRAGLSQNSNVAAALLTRLDRSPSPTGSSRRSGSHHSSPQAESSDSEGEMLQPGDFPPLPPQIQLFLNSLTSPPPPQPSSSASLPSPSASMHDTVHSVKAQALTLEELALEPCPNFRSYCRKMCSSQSTRGNLTVPSPTVSPRKCVGSVIEAMPPPIEQFSTKPSSQFATDFMGGSLREDTDAPWPSVMPSGDLGPTAESEGLLLPTVFVLPPPQQPGDSSFSSRLPQPSLLTQGTEAAENLRLLKPAGMASSPKHKAKPKAPLLQNSQMVVALLTRAPCRQPVFSA